MVRAVLDEVCGTQEAQHGSGWAAGERNVIFYADDGRIAGRDHKWVHYVLTVTVAMFCSMENYGCVEIAPASAAGAHVSD